MIREELKEQEHRLAASISTTRFVREDIASEQTSESEYSEGVGGNNSQHRCTTVPCDLNDTWVSVRSDDGQAGEAKRQIRHTCDILPTTPGKVPAPLEPSPVQQRQATRRREDLSRSTSSNSGPLSAVLRGTKFVLGKDKKIGTVKDLEDARAIAVLENQCLTPSTTLQHIPGSLFDVIPQRVNSQSSALADSLERIRNVRTAALPSPSGVHGIPGLHSPAFASLEGKLAASSYTSKSSSSHTLSLIRLKSPWRDPQSRGEHDSSNDQQQQKSLSPKLPIMAAKHQQFTVADTSPVRRGRGTVDQTLPCTPALIQSVDEACESPRRSSRQQARSPRHGTYDISTVQEDEPSLFLSRNAMKQATTNEFDNIPGSRSMSFSPVRDDHNTRRTSLASRIDKTHSAIQRSRQRTISNQGSRFTFFGVSKMVDPFGTKDCTEPSTGFADQIIAALRPGIDDVQSLRMARQDELTSGMMEGPELGTTDNSFRLADSMHPGVETAMSLESRKRHESERRVCSPLWLRVC